MLRCHGDTVLVDAGYYKEKNLVINKRIVLKGINYPVLDGEKKYEIISVKANGVVVDGFRINTFRYFESGRSEWDKNL